MKTRVPETRFMVDHMVFKLGKHLRILGYDAVWNEKVRTHELITRANVEQRVFLTRNMHFADQYPRPKHMLILKDIDSMSNSLTQLSLNLHWTLIHIYFQSVSGVMQCLICWKTWK